METETQIQRATLLSEYALPQDFTCVYEMEHRSSLSATNNSKKTVERLFCNKAEGNTKKLTLF